MYSSATQDEQRSEVGGYASRDRLVCGKGWINNSETTGEEDSNDKDVRGWQQVDEFGSWVLSLKAICDSEVDDNRRPVVRKLRKKSTRLKACNV